MWPMYLKDRENPTRVSCFNLGLLKSICFFPAKIDSYFLSIFNNCRRPEEAVIFPETKIIDSCEPSDEDAGTQTLDFYKSSKPS